MKTKIGILALLIVSGCASSPPAKDKPIQTVGEAVSNDGEFRTGVYTKSNRENVFIEVRNLRQELDSNNRRIYELQHELDFIRRSNDDLASANDRLRVRINQNSENELLDAQRKSIVPSMDPQRNPASQPTDTEGAQ